jgi:high affinity sulfate transporter 1
MRAMRAERVVPILGVVRSYRRADARADVVAGVTVSALVVPKALGYAGIAQVPVESGLYAAAAGALVYAVFGTSRQISTGPSSALAAIAASAVVLTGVSAGDETAHLVAAITLVTGGVFLLGALFRMGWLSRLLSKAVICGFLFGAAIDVVIGELPKLTGTDAAGTNSWRQFASWIDGVSGVHWGTLTVGVVALGVVLALHLTAPKVPGALVLVIGGLVVSRLLGLSERGVAVVGDVPRGLPVPRLPPGELVWDHAATIATAALALFLIGFSQTAGDARVFASRHRYRIRVDQEMVAQGMSNVGAGALQGMPVSTSLSASSLNDSAGARTPMASVVTGIIVVLTLLVLAPLFSDLPKPVLAAIIIDAVVFGMIDVPEMRRLWRVKRIDFWIAVLAIIGVLSAGVLAGVVVGIALSIGWLVYVSSTPALTELGREPGSPAFRSVDEHPDSERYPGVFIVRFDGGLTFVTAEGLADGIEDRLRRATEPISGVVIDFVGVNFVDSQGADQLGQLVESAHRDRWSLRLARVRGDVMAVLDADGVIDRLGSDRVHPTVAEALRTELHAQQTSREGPVDRR